jgi:IclR family transcriptional regulator, pca regulon regulatory protein
MSDEPTNEANTATPLDSAAGDPNFMASLARGLAVVCAFTDQRRHLTIAQISRLTGIPRAAVRRCLYTLEKLGYVGSDGAGYVLRPAIAALGHAYLGPTPLAVLAQSYVDRVSGLVHESCSVACLEADDVVYVARAAVSHIVSINLKPGSRLPAYCTSMGRVLLAELPEERRNAYLAALRPRAYTDKTVTDPGRLRDVLATVQRAGYAIVDEELEVGLRSIAVPVRSAAGRVVAAMNVGAQVARATVHDLETRVLPPLRAAAQDLGAVLDARY